MDYEDKNISALPSQVAEVYKNAGKDTSFLPTEVQKVYEGTDDSFKILGQSFPKTQEFMNYNPDIETYSGGYNYGDDFGAPSGTPVSLPQGSWKVIESSSNGDFNRGYGNSVLVENTATGEKLRFSHLSQTPLFEGQVFTGGQIGISGDTGNTTGPHLDLEYYDPQGNLGDISNSDYGRYL